LPERMRDLLREVRIPGESGERPLVKSERTLFAAHRPPKPDQPPNWTVYFLGAGLGFGALLAGLAAWPATVRLRVSDWELPAACWDSSSVCWADPAFILVVHRPQGCIRQCEHLPARALVGRACRLRGWGGVGAARVRAQGVLGGGNSGRLCRHRNDRQGIPWPFARQFGAGRASAAGVDRSGLGISLGAAAKLAADCLRHGDFVGKRVHIHANIVYSLPADGWWCDFHAWAWLLAHSY
jgi:hypothetical protein